MNYTSTRGNGGTINSSGAILTGLAPNGGLFVPVTLPSIDFEALQGMGYAEAAHAILSVLLPDYEDTFLRTATDGSYGENFEHKAGELVKVGEALYSLELWHGPTSAFKDYALQLMPKLLVEARSMHGQAGDTVILVATSGDTGSAALAGFANRPGIKIACFYPEGGTSVLQRLQMTTQDAENVAVYGIKGNFDDAQRAVKGTFSNEALARELREKYNAGLSSANSINWGRLSPQIVYYATSYLKLCAEGAVRYGQPVDFCVPTGNFGDIMAGWYAKKLGLPIGRLICASNKNNVLTEFLDTGRYDAKREFYKTSSPSMDILVSSNLERLLWHASGQNAQAVAGWMQQLAQNGEYTVDAPVLSAIREVFAAGWVPEKDVFDEIAVMQTQHGYLCDPHTAVAFRLARQRQMEGRPVVVLSTASPYKFSRQVLGALGQPVPEDEFGALQQLQAFSGVPAPANLLELQHKVERFTAVIGPEEIGKVPLGFY